MVRNELNRNLKNAKYSKKWFKKDFNGSKDIQTQKEISNELERLAEENNLEMLTLYESEKKEIIFHCKKCRKQFSEIYKNIKRRSQSKLFCPFCFPELHRNYNISKKLKRHIMEYTLNELKIITINDLSEVEILVNIKTIKDFVFRQIEIQISNKSFEFKEYLKKYIDNIAWFLTKIKLLSETNQKINVYKVATETHDKNLTSLKQWYKITKEVVRYIRDALGFNLRTTHQDPLSLSESKKNSIRTFKTYYKLIKGPDRKGITITYLDIDFKTEIRIPYIGKCQGVKEYCPFDIDNKFLPSLSYHHRLENYKKIIKKEGYEYIQPRDIYRHSFNKALKLMQTQIGGLELTCVNCHSIKHAIRYTFPQVFIFLKSLSLKNINENPTNILNRVKRLANEYFGKNKERYTISRSNTAAKIKIEIKRSILGFVKRKYIIEYIFGKNYICPICQKANINDHLICFEAHHTNLDLLKKIEKIEFAKEYERKSIDWLIKNLINQECIFVCSNCHAMIKATNFREFVLIILKNQGEARFVKDFYKHLAIQVELQRNIILQWKYQLKNKSYNFPNPFQLIFKRGEALDQKLVCIYYICETFSQKHYFNAKLFNYVLNKGHTHFNGYKDQLINNDYIQYRKEKHQFNQKFIVITPKAVKRAKKIIKNKSKEFPIKFKNLILIWKNRFINYHKSL